jgi:hypothetical protein
MPAYTPSSTVNRPPSRPAVEYISDWQLFPDEPDDKPLPPSGTDAAAAGEAEVNEATEAT